MSEGNTPPSNPYGGDAQSGQPGPPPPPPPYGSPPPIPGGYGAAPPPPPQYSAPGGYQQPYSAGDAISYGWTKFKDNAGTMILITLLLFVVAFAIQTIGSLGMSAMGLGSSGFNAAFDPNDTTSTAVATGFSVASFLASLVLGLITSLVTAIFSGALYKGALLITDGHTPSIGDMFNGWNKVTLIIATLLVTIFTYLGLIALFIGAIVVAVLLWFTPYFVVDHENISPMDAIKASFELVKNNVGNVLLFGLLTILIWILGICACCIGLLVAMPVTSIAMAFTYRRLQGQPVAP